MKRINFLILAALVAFGFSVTGCDDEEDNPAEDAGTDIIEDTDTGPVEPLADQCNNDDDAPVYLEVQGELSSIAQSCAIGSCNALAPDADPDEVSTCVADCVGEEAGISSGCASCTGEVVLCVAQNCLSAGCATSPDSAECLACRDENGCDDNVDNCVGDLSEWEEPALPGEGEACTVEEGCAEGFTCDTEQDPAVCVEAQPV